MKKYLLTEDGNYYKANLHCHSTYSDGNWTPEEIKKNYLAQGYSIVAFTDHDVFIPHPELADDNFLPLNGFELEVNEDVGGKPFKFVHTCHMCMIARDPETRIHPLWHRSKYLFGHATEHRDEVAFDETLPDFEREYTPECVTAMMRKGREDDFFVTYNHPRWSLETYAQYANYHGMHAMEIYNHGCFMVGFADYSDTVYDEMLRNGERIFCIATDDNHNPKREGRSFKDSFGGFVMIKAEKLEYRCITDALFAGNFYSSRGPEIKALWYDSEDSCIHVKCSDAVKVICSSGRRGQRTCYAQDFGQEFINEAVLPVREDDIYVRISVYDKDMRTADTNAYFVEELMSK